MRANAASTPLPALFVDAEEGVPDETAYGEVDGDQHQAAPVLGGEKRA